MEDSISRMDHMIRNRPDDLKDEEVAGIGICVGVLPSGNKVIITVLSEKHPHYERHELGEESVHG